MLICCHVASAEYYTETNLIAYSEPVTVHGALHEWKSEFFGGTKALTHDSIETGWRQDQYEIGLLRRYDYELEFSRDTAEITYNIKNKFPLDVNRVYQLELLVRNSYSEGAYIRYATSYSPKLMVTYGVSLLQGIELTEGRIKGSNDDNRF